MEVSLQRQGKKEKNDQKKLRTLDRPICLLTGIKMLLQDNLRLRILDRSVCVVIRIELLFKENKDIKKGSKLGEMLIKHTIPQSGLMQRFMKYKLAY